MPSRIPKRGGFYVFLGRAFARKGKNYQYSVDSFIFHFFPILQLRKTKVEKKYKLWLADENSVEVSQDRLSVPTITAEVQNFIGSELNSTL